MIFFGKKKRVLGFDLSKNSVKVVELEHSGEKPNLVTYGGLEFPGTTLESDNVRNQEILIKTIQEVLERARVTTREIVGSLPPQHVFSSILLIPKVQEKELSEAIRWEAKQYVPVPLEEVVMDWQKIGEDEKSKKIKVYLVAAPQKLVQRYLDIYRAVNLTPLALETEPLALIRSLVSPDNPSPVIIVDIGAYETNISVVENHVLQLSRTITSGSETITKAIASNLGVTNERAEQFKKDFGLKREKLEGQILKSVQPMINILLTEIKRSIEFYKKEGSAEIKEIILSGGGANLPGLVDYLNENLGIKTDLGNPWLNVNYSAALAEKINEIGPAFAVAVGLALRKAA